MPGVLIVDADVPFLRVVELSLKVRGYSVLTVKTGMEALSTLTGHAPDVVVLELALPDVNGFELIRRIRVCTLVPLVVFTYPRGTGERLSAFEAGADRFLAKPVGIDELVSCIEAVTDRKAMPESE